MAVLIGMGWLEYVATCEIPLGVQDYIFNNIYQAALNNEQHQVSLQVFRMILCGIPRTRNTTLWKQFTKVKGFLNQVTSLQVRQRSKPTIYMLTRRKNEQHQISLQVFRMILCGIPRSRKTAL